MRTQKLASVGEAEVSGGRVGFDKGLLSLALVLASSVLLALISAPRALAVGESLPWSAPVYISPEGASGLAPSLGVLADGTEVAGWEQSSPGGWFPVVASRPQGAATWSDPSPIASGPIDAPGTYTFGPRMAWDRQGRYVAAWLVTRQQAKGDGTFVTQPIVEGAHGTVTPGSPASFSPDELANRHPPNGYTFPIRPDVQMTPDGDGVVNFPYNTCCGSTYLALVPIRGAVPLGTPGTPATSLETRAVSGSQDEYNGDVPSVSVGPPALGGATAATATIAAITGRFNYGVDPYMADVHVTGDPSTWPATGTTLPVKAFGSTVTVLSDGRQLVTAPSGDGKLLLWRTGDLAPTVIDPAQGGGGSPIKASVAAFADGSATIAYMGQDVENGVTRIRAVTVNSAGTVSDPVSLSGTDANARDPRVAYAPDGAVHVAWTQNATAGQASTGVYASYRLSDGDFLPVPQQVIGNVAEAHAARVAVAPDGFVTIVAQIRDGAEWRIAAFRHANPAVPRNVDKPTIAYTGALDTGTRLTCKTGTWTASPTSYAFQWLRDGTPLGPASPDPARDVTAGDLGHALVCRVVASNAAGSGQADTAALAVGAGGPMGAGAPRFALKGAAVVSKDGTSATLTLIAPGPGAITATSKAKGKASAAAARHKPKSKVAPLLKPARLVVRAVGTAHLTVRLSLTGRAVLKRKGRLTLPISLRFQPSKGGAAIASTRITFKPRKIVKRRH